MARCGCANDRCACTVIAGENVVVSGTGSRSNPYIIDAIASSDPGGGGGPAERIPGEIIMFGGQSLPTGWLLCDGRAVSRTVYPNLYAAVGTLYGAGDGVTTFNLPNLSARFPRGSSDTAGVGTLGGAASVSKTLTTANLPPHSHTMAHTHSTAHTHAITHTHSIDHDHAAVTSSSDGSHDHDLQISDNTGSGGNIARGGASFTLGNGPIRANGAHTHSVNLPNYTGTSGAASTGTSGAASSATSGGSSAGSTGNGPGTSTPLTVETVPPYISLNFIIRT